ncbi:MAG: hypothetical protein V7K97_23475 [Nostoc sp.]|uniref:hypothetical protein n=1 Tax=Nostoc sp. TaxID=1180 RepID=UPI002FFD0194
MKICKNPGERSVITSKDMLMSLEVIDLSLVMMLVLRGGLILGLLSPTIDL